MGQDRRSSHDVVSTPSLQVEQFPPSLQMMGYRGQLVININSSNAFEPCSFCLALRSTNLQDVASKKGNQGSMTLRMTNKSRRWAWCMVSNYFIVYQVRFFHRLSQCLPKLAVDVVIVCRSQPLHEQGVGKHASFDPSSCLTVGWTQLGNVDRSLKNSSLRYLTARASRHILKLEMAAIPSAGNIQIIKSIFFTWSMNSKGKLFYFISLLRFSFCRLR